LLPWRESPVRLYSRSGPVTGERGGYFTLRSLLTTAFYLVVGAEGTQNVRRLERGRGTGGAGRDGYVLNSHQSRTSLLSFRTGYGRAGRLLYPSLIADDCLFFSLAISLHGSKRQVGATRVAINIAVPNDVRQLRSDAVVKHRLSCTDATAYRPTTHTSKRSRSAFTTASLRS
jgi:hypothetical protein